MKKIIIFLLSLLLLASCRPNFENNLPKEVNTYSDLFEIWWDEMDKNYVYWNLDSPSNEWDEVKERVLPEMESLGSIASSSDESALKALRLYFDIIKDLRDGHYSASFSLGSYSVRFAPSEIRAMAAAGLNSDQIFNRIIDPNPGIDPYSYSDSELESIETVFIRIFDIYHKYDVTPGAYMDYGTVGDDRQNLKKYFSEAGYVITPSSYSIGSLNLGNYCILVGKSNDGIVYLNFNGFHYYNFRQVRESDEWAERILSLFEKFVETIENDDVKGVIIDLRGNTGGIFSDITALFSCFGSLDIPYTEIRNKKDDNRHSYTSWHEFYIKGTRGEPFKAPVAILTNRNTASSAEATVMYFQSLREHEGINFTTVGNYTAGANGFPSSSTVYGAGGFTIEPNVSVNMAFGQHRKYDGTWYEGIGIEPEIPLDFDPGSFAHGTDGRLNRAFAYIRENM